MNRIQKIEILTSTISNISDRLGLWREDAISKNLMLTLNRSRAVFLLMAEEFLKDKRLPELDRERIIKAQAIVKELTGSRATNINDLEDESEFRSQQRDMVLEAHKAHSLTYNVWDSVWDRANLNTRMTAIK